MKGLTQKLLLSILTVVVTTIALGTTTFAWFTITNTARIQEFQAEVVGDSGIEVSFDKVSWYTTMGASVIEEYLFTQAEKDAATGYQGDGFKFDHVTTQDGMNFSGLGSAPTGRYLNFVLHFRSPNVTNLILTGLTLSSPTATLWTPNVDFRLAGADTDWALAGVEEGGFRAANGARISVTEVGALAPALIYENSDAGGNVVLGHHENASFANYNTTDPDNPIWEPGNAGALYFNGAVHYYIQTNGGNDESDSAPVGFDLINVPETRTNLNNLDGATIENIGVQVATLTMNSQTGYNEGSVRIRVWLEGWDPDTYNSILDGKILLSFIFKDEYDLPVTP